MGGLEFQTKRDMSVRMVFSLDLRFTAVFKVSEQSHLPDANKCEQVERELMPDCESFSCASGGGASRRQALTMQQTVPRLLPDMIVCALASAIAVLSKIPDNTVT